MSVRSLTLRVNDMVCSSCEERITKALKKLNGILELKVSFKKGTVYVKFDTNKCSYKNIESAIKNSGYSVFKYEPEDEKSEVLSIISIIIFAFIILNLSKNSGWFNISESLNSNIGLFALFVIGLFSSLHCVGMCGGIMMSQSISIISNEKSKSEKIKPALLYNLGRIISYTILGGIVGGIGSVFSISTNFQAALTLFAGIFMVLMGFNMSGFKLFRSFSIKLPWSTCKSKNKSKSSFVVGLLNGFMPCGPLQAMQLYALSTGSILKGSLSMFFFALGTVPLMILFGLTINALNQKNSAKLMKISGIIIVVLGISMASRALSLSSFNMLPSNNNITASVVSADSKAIISDNKQTIKITAGARGYSPRTIYLQKGIETELIIEGERLTSCNNEIIIPSLDIRKKLTTGANIVTFTPSDNNDIKYSCWMGMQRGVIKVVDDLNSLKEENESAINNNITTSNNDNSILLKTPEISLDKISDVIKLKPSEENDYSYSSYNDIISILGDGTISYPYIDDKKLKIVYWTFKENNIEYFLDATFFEDNLINIESKLVDEISAFSTSKFDNYSELEEKIISIKSLSELETLIGKGIKVKDFYTEGKEAIYGWKHDSGITIAYVSNDEIFYTNTGNTLDELISDSTSCH